MKNDELTKLHATLTQMLAEVDRICRKCGIEYFLDSGTALGAIRHGGFIPWDDDVDLGMIRGEYERFVATAEKELSDEYILLKPEMDVEYLKYHVKLVKKNSFFPEYRAEKLKYPGIYIDIFPFDKISNNPLIRKSEIFWSLRLRNMIRLRRAAEFDGKWHRRMLYPIYKMIPLTWFEMVQNWLWNRHNNDNQCHFVTCYLYKMLADKNICFPLNMLSSTQDIAFEGKCFRIMSDYDGYLRTMYGDYMKMPPVEKQEYHAHGEIRF